MLLEFRVERRSCRHGERHSCGPTGCNKQRSDVDRKRKFFAATAIQQEAEEFATSRPVVAVISRTSHLFRKITSLLVTRNSSMAIQKLRKRQLRTGPASSPSLRVPCLWPPAPPAAAGTAMYRAVRIARAALSNPAARLHFAASSFMLSLAKSLAYGVEWHGEDVPGTASQRHEHQLAPAS